MAKCDTPTTPKHILISDLSQDDWCRRCHAELIRSDDVLPAKLCRECAVLHLKSHMFEKLEGWLCFTCAKAYDEKLLKELTKA